MKLVRYAQGATAAWGVVEAAQVRPIRGDVYSRFELAPEKLDLAALTLLAPAEPALMVCCGLNYSDALDAKGQAVSRPDMPRFFFKPAAAVNAPGAALRFPRYSQEWCCEVELCVVLKSWQRNMSALEAKTCILGYTVGNETAALDYVRDRSDMLRGRAFDGSGPLGPVLATELDPSDLELRTRVNGAVVQQGRTSNMFFDIPALLSELSRFLTLGPGDVVWTGTPRGRCIVKEGDRVEAEISNIGVLANTVAAPF
jgi:2-keto-4-pentenoate hydratase/2-oxohepta-3-ene-1,7-dioic acid hydratase in catechol pathway